MVKEWLKKKTSLEEYERRHLNRGRRLGPASVTSDCEPQWWLDFKRQIQKGDELWEFRSPIETWLHLRGREGICIVREGEIIDSIVTALN
jgi:hypothetical protein